MMPASGPVPKAAQRCTRALHPAPSRNRPQRRQIHLAHAPGQGSSRCAVRAYPGIPKTEKRPELQFFAIRDCCGAPKRVSRRKSAANRLIGSQFVLCTDKRGSAIAKKLHGRRIICFRNGKITITGRILKRDADKRARIPLADADGKRTPASAATDIGRRCSGAVNGARLAAQRAAATGGQQQRRRACASKSASGVLTSAGKLKSPWGWPNVPPHGL